MSKRDIAQEIIERLETEHDVLAVDEIDLRDSPPPLVTIWMHKDGTQFESLRPKKKSIKMVVNEYWELTPIPLLTALDKEDALEDLIMQRPERDGPDTLNSLADSVTVESTVSYIESKESRVGVTQAIVAITYYDEG